MELSQSFQKEPTFQAFKILKADQLDFFMHVRRLCECDCEACEGRVMHPILNCRDSCQNSDMQTTQDFSLEDDCTKICNCQCPFCQNGITISTHVKMDCLVRCHFSNVEKLI